MQEIQEIRAVVFRWGNSLGVRLPRAVVDDLGLKPGDELEVVVLATRIEVVKDGHRRRAVDRMRARGLRFPDGCVFDRDEAAAR